MIMYSFLDQRVSCLRTLLVLTKLVHYKHKKKVEKPGFDALFLSFLLLAYKMQLCLRMFEKNIIKCKFKMCNWWNKSINYCLDLVEFFEKIKNSKYSIKSKENINKILGLFSAWDEMKNKLNKSEIFNKLYIFIYFRFFFQHSYSSKKKYNQVCLKKELDNKK